MCEHEMIKVDSCTILNREISVGGYFFDNKSVNKNSLMATFAEFLNQHYLLFSCFRLIIFKDFPVVFQITLFLN
jgi:hypothetical protein